MTQILNSLPLHSFLSENTHIFCGYRNQTPHLQIARIANIPNWYFEKVIFPGEHLLFYSLPKAELEIYTNEIVTDKILCSQLQIENHVPNG